MSRVINPNAPGTERNRLKRGVALSLRELIREPEPNAKTRDLAAFIALSLDAIVKTVDTTVAAWEKRDYWLKADRFRRDWEWAERLGAEMRTAVLAGDWAGVAQAAVQIAQKLSDVKVSEHHRMGAPWVGAWMRLQDLTLE
ncbi:MAG: hypothetical protein KKD28_02525 [Chloroflexi bacterium]|nr:hypothetical protein [Chloroflexota bacterium]